MANLRLPLIVCIISLWIVPIAQATESLYLSVFLEFEQEYNDNVYHTAFDQVRDLISHLGARTKGELKTEKSHIELDYRARRVIYYDYEGDDGIDTTEMNYTDHNLSLDAFTILTDRLKVGITEKYLRSRRVSEYYYLTNRISLAEYWDNRISPYLEYQLGERLKLCLKYQYDFLDYVESYTLYDQDSSEHRGYLTLEYALNPRSSVDLDYQYWVRDYETFTPYKAHQVTIGYKREFTEVFSGEIRCGYQTVDYKEEVESIIEDWQGFVYNISTTARTEKSDAHLSFEQTQANLADYGGGYYKVRMFSSDIGHTFLGKISARLKVSYQQCRYSEWKVMTGPGALEERSDDTWSVCTKIEYPIHRRLSLSLELRHAERDSNSIDIFGDYVGNQILFTIKPRYERRRP